MRQTQQRHHRRRTEPETVIDLRREPVADTSAAGELLAEIERVLAD